MKYLSSILIVDGKNETKVPSCGPCIYVSAFVFR